MTIGHVQLDTLQLKLKGNGLPTQVLANQMAPKIGSGEGEYSNLDTWAAWIQETWEDGLGRTNPYKNPGVLYSEAETRIPNQIICSPAHPQVDTHTLVRDETDCRNWPENDGAGQEAFAFAIEFTTPSSLIGTWWYMWIYADIYGATPTAKIYTDSAGEPGTLVDTGSLPTALNVPGFQWYLVSAIENAGLTTSTTYWLVIESATAIKLGKGNASYTGGYKIKATAGGAWANASAGVTPAYTSNKFALRTAAVAPKGAGFFRLGTTLYCYTAQRIWKYDVVNDEWDDVGSISATDTVSNAVSWDGKVYLSSGAGTTYTTMTDAEVIASGGASARAFAKHNGYLWRASGHQVAYSSDGSSWSATIDVSDPDMPIRSMAGLGQNLYCATDDGLYAVLPGDFAIGVSPWGSESDTNGMRMINHQGALYIAVNRRIYRFTEDGAMQDIFLSSEDDVQTTAVGRVWAMASMNNWLLVLIGEGLRSRPQLLAYQDGVWHFLAAFPEQYQSSVNSYPEYDIYYDRTNSYVWVMTPGHLTYRIYMPDYALNPYNDTNYRYDCSGWVEWDWFYGPIREAEKDWESVTITGDFTTGSHSCLVYYMEGDSTTWTLLGTVTSDGQELRWDITNRPATNRIKLGLLLRSTSSASTPRIRSMRLKYHTMTRDWFRWTLPVDVSGGLGGRPKQELLDGTYRTETAAQLKAALDALATQVEPMIYTDVDGLQYEVKVTDASFNYTMVTYNAQSAVKEWEGVYSLTIEQVTEGTYTAP